MELLTNNEILQALQESDIDDFSSNDNEVDQNYVPCESSDSEGDEEENCCSNSNFEADEVDDFKNIEFVPSVVLLQFAFSIVPFWIQGIF